MIKNLGSYVIESIKYKKSVTDNIMVRIPNLQDEVRLTDDRVIRNIQTKIDTLAQKLNRGT